MQYTVWSRGELIGTTMLDFRTLGFDLARSGHFYPTARGNELIEEIASDTHCMRAYMHRNYRDANGKGLLDREYVNSDWFGDIAEHLQQCAKYSLELRDDTNALVAVSEIGIQDREPGFSYPPSTSHDGDAQREDDAAMQKLFDDFRSRDKDVLRRPSVDDSIAAHVRSPIDDLDLDPDACLFGDDGRWEPCDITVPVGWGYEDQRGDYELGSGWNETIREIPVFPRYQIHVVLSQ